MHIYHYAPYEITALSRIAPGASNDAQSVVDCPVR
jgi:hypothetical protein